MNLNLTQLLELWGNAANDNGWSWSMLAYRKKLMVRHHMEHLGVLPWSRRK